MDVNHIFLPLFTYYVPKYVFFVILFSSSSENQSVSFHFVQQAEVIVLEVVTYTVVSISGIFELSLFLRGGAHFLCIIMALFYSIRQ